MVGGHKVRVYPGLSSVGRETRGGGTKRGPGGTTSKLLSRVCRRSVDTPCPTSTEVQEKGCDRFLYRRPNLGTRDGGEEGRGKKAPGEGGSLYRNRVGRQGTDGGVDDGRSSAGPATGSVRPHRRRTTPDLVSIRVSSLWCHTGPRDTSPLTVPSCRKGRPFGLVRRVPTGGVRRLPQPEEQSTSLDSRAEVGRPLPQRARPYVPFRPRSSWKTGRCRKTPFVGSIPDPPDTSP